MPRFYNQKTCDLIQDVPPHLFFLVREALALRQRVVVARQSLHFLKRCRSTNLFPSFITNKRLGRMFKLEEDHPMIRKLYKSMLGVAIKRKQYIPHSALLMCNSKEEACRRLLGDTSWRRIESGSRHICDTLRSNIKSSLCAKFDTLLDRA